MKPLLQMIRPSAFLKNISIVQKLDNGVHRNYVDRNEFISYIQSISRPPDVDTVLYVRCACNRDFIYTEITDIPNGNVNCECGQKVIEYN